MRLIVRRKGRPAKLNAERLAEGSSLAVASEPAIVPVPINEPATIRIVLVDDHPLVLDGLADLFSSEPDVAVVASCRKGEEALTAVRAHPDSVLLLDLRMPGMHGLAVLRAIRASMLPTRVVIFTAAIEDDEIVDALLLGARGLMLKEMSPRLLLQCIRTVHAGGRWLERQLSLRAVERLLRRETGMRRIAEMLSAPEMDIVRAMARGVRNKEIADQLHIGEDTLKTHLRDIYERLGLDGRSALVRYAQDNALI